MANIDKCFQGGGSSNKSGLSYLHTSSTPKSYTHASKENFMATDSDSDFSELAAAQDSKFKKKTIPSSKDMKLPAIAGACKV
jgi:hypothetical protein